MANFRLYFLPIRNNISKQFQGVNQIDFYNQGANEVVINGRKLPQYAGFSFVGFPGEIDMTNYEITFSVNNAPGNELIVTIKKYI